YAAPPSAVTPKGARALPGSALVAVTPSTAILTAAHPAASGGVGARVVNTPASESEGTLPAPIPGRRAIAGDPLGAAVDEPRVSFDGGVARLTLRPWQIATVRLK